MAMWVWNMSQENICNTIEHFGNESKLSCQNYELEECVIGRKGIYMEILCGCVDFCTGYILYKGSVLFTQLDINPIPLADNEAKPSFPCSVEWNNMKYTRFDDFSRPIASSI